MEAQKLDAILNRMERERQTTMKSFEDLTNEEVFNQHANLIVHIGNDMLQSQKKRFVVDERNKQILRFMLYYFNNCHLAESVYPDKHYKLHNNLLMCGTVGTGKTLLMQVFSEYLRLTENPNQFFNLSVTQMVNYYTIHNNLDRYTYNEEESKGFKSIPLNICLNDIGVESKTYFGMDTKLLTNEFLHARNEIWVQYGKHGHLTTNLAVEQLKTEFKDGFGRLIDRFKTYNVIALIGDSRR